MSLADFAKLMVALIFVLGLMGGLTLILKKLGYNQAPVTKGGEKRLSVSEILPLDQRRRLAIIKCGPKEHLVILGQNGETVIDRDINNSGGTR